MVPTPSERVLARLPAAALDALVDLGGVHLVGGAVRDVLLDRMPNELDLVVEGDGPAIAGELARRLGGTVRVHETFGTATVELPHDERIDVASARAEDYPEPGALPVVRAATLEEDLRRRDFSVNAIAVGLSDDVRGRLTAVPGALEDLEALRLRVLHDGSFLDDATRLIRLARYGTRLGLVLHPRTEQLARAAFAVGAPGTVGQSRWAAELWLLLGEPGVVDGLALLSDLADGPIPGPTGGLTVDVDVLRRMRVHESASHRHSYLAALVAHVDEKERRAWLESAHIPEPGIVLDAAQDPVGLAARMRDATRASDLERLLRRRSAEAVAVAGAYGAEDEARRWFGLVRGARLEITGDDLIRAGIAPGPEIGRRLDAALAARLDRNLLTREEQLAVALADLP